MRGEFPVRGTRLFGLIYYAGHFIYIRFMVWGLRFAELWSSMAMAKTADGLVWNRGRWVRVFGVNKGRVLVWFCVREQSREIG